MTTISTIDFVAMTNISSLLTTNYGGVEMVYNLNNPFSRRIVENSFLSYSTLTTYDISGISTLYTVDISSSQASSNIGKYIYVRNNCGSTLSLTLTGVSGIASPVTLSNAQSATFVVASTSNYALF